MIGPRVHAPQSARDHLPVVVGEVGEPTESRDVTGSEDAGPRFERRRVHLQPTALRLCEPGCAPRLRVGAAARGNQQPVGRDHGSGLQMDDDGRALARWLRDCFSTATHGSPIISVMPSASRCGRSAAPASGSSRPRNVGPASITVTLEPRRAKACPSSTPMAPPPRIASEAGSSLGIAAWRLVQNSTVSRPGMGGIAAVLPLAITTARRAMSCSPPTVDRAQVRQSSFASKEPGPGRLHRGGRPAVVEVACHPQHAFGDLGEVDGPFHA